MLNDVQYDNTVIISYLIIGVVVFLLIVMFILLVVNPGARLFKAKARQIQIGMTKEQCLQIMGLKFSQSILKNGDEILEWGRRISGSGGGYSSNGISGFSYSSGYKMSLAVTLHNGIVIAFESHNLD